MILNKNDYPSLNALFGDYSEDEGITVFSMFDGVSCGRIALQRANIKVKQYFTSEIDKYASAISRCNWHNTELGDITKINFNDLPKLDLIL